MMADHRVSYRRHLPHWQPAGATLFITFRLAGSLPHTVVATLQEKREQEKRALSHASDVQGHRKQAYQDALDVSDSGPHWLADPQVASIVAEALHYRHERAYDLLAFCIMPNHVHLVCTPLQREDGTYYAIHRILQSLKQHSARQANKVLGRQGTFWQEESYDHVVRDADELTRVVQYVISNPVKAGLISEWEAWPWTYKSG